ncbi:MAG: PhoH family protein [Clostridiales bacterium]|nr:PhoH family protein [Clostridiales bacterium]
MERTLSVDTVEQLIALFGKFDENVRIIESETNVVINAREREISIIGTEEMADVAAEVMQRLLNMIRKHEEIDKGRIRYAIDLVREGRGECVGELMSDVVAFTQKGRPVRCKTLGQRKYVQAIRDNTVVLGIGPAGTGKTFLAVAMAVLSLKNKDISRIILTRPAVEAGEKLGFLPGDLQHKVDPYLRPLYDALYDFLGDEAFNKLLERGTIEVAPLAYMRGRTLNDSFIILDEAQNCTIEQMKMFLTRFGEGSKVVVTGDITQTDLPSDHSSGLRHAMQVLKGVEGLEVVMLSHKDVVRHEMVQRIVRAYERAEKRK